MMLSLNLCQLQNCHMDSTTLTPGSYCALRFILQSLMKSIDQGGASNKVLHIRSKNLFQAGNIQPTTHVTLLYLYIGQFHDIMWLFLGESPASCSTLASCMPWVLVSW